MSRRRKSDSPAVPSVPPAAPAGRFGRQFTSTLLMLLTSAILLSLLFPPFYCFFLAPVALVPFCLCILRRPMSPRYLLAYFLLGFTFFAGNLYWLAPVTIVGMLGLACFVALYFALFAFGLHRLVVQMRLPATLAVPLVWTAVEYLRATCVLGGFPWYILGNCLAPVPALIQAADVFGVWGLTFLIALLNGLAVDLFRLPLRQKVPPGAPTRSVRARRVAPDGTRFSPLLLRLMQAVFLITALEVCYGIYRLNETSTFTHDGPRVAVIQEDIPQTLKDSDADDTLRRYLARAEEASNAAPRPDLVAWPETMVTANINEGRIFTIPAEYAAPAYQGVGGLSKALHDIADTLDKRHAAAATLPDPKSRKDQAEEADSIAWEIRNNVVYAALQERVQTHQMPWLVGYTSVDFQPNVIQNRTLLLTPGKTTAERTQEYSKRHLVPFGEFTPFHDVPLLGTIASWFSPMPPDFNNEPGAAWTRFRLTVSTRATDAAATQIFDSMRFYKFATPICFEDTMPEPARRMSAPQYDGGRKVDFLVNVSNDGWFQSVELDQHLQACQLRAVENRVPIARSVNTGNSGFIDSCGRIVALVRDSQGNSIHAAGTASSVLQLDSRITFFSRIGDLFPIICGVLSTLLVGWTLVRPRRGSAAIASAAPESA